MAVFPGRRERTGPLGRKGVSSELSMGPSAFCYVLGVRCVDGWVRMRLRSTLRKRRERRGRGRGLDHQRWPDAFFRAQGLFALTTAFELACPSSQR